MSLAQPGVGDQVVVRAGAKLGAADNALAGEAGLLEGALLGEVVDIGLGLDAVGIGLLEQVVREQPLGDAAEAVAAGLGDERDADVPRPRLGRRPVVDLVPADGADRLPVSHPLDDQLAVPLVAQRALGQRLADVEAVILRRPEVVELALRLRRTGPGVEDVGVSRSRVPQADRQSVMARATRPCPHRRRSRRGRGGGSSGHRGAATAR